jgi:hypothetical protein
MGKRKRGLTLPGSNYIGPFNSLDSGPPKTTVDEIAYQHDHQYDQLMEHHVNPYLTSNEADREMIRALKDMPHKWKHPIQFSCAYAGIKTKMALARVFGKGKDVTPVERAVSYEKLYREHCNKRKRYGE